MSKPREGLGGNRGRNPCVLWFFGVLVCHVCLVGRFQSLGSHLPKCAKPVKVLLATIWKGSDEATEGGIRKSYWFGKKKRSKPGGQYS